MSVIKSVQLFFQEGSSDKVYFASIVEDGLAGQYTVRVEWGRRGSSLNTGTKAVRVPLAAAEKAYDKVVREKTHKGYQPITEEVKPAAVAPPVGQGSASRAAASGARVRLGVCAQLLNPIEQDELESLLGDPAHVAQQKFDGMRLLTHVRDGQVVCTNRQGQVTSAPLELVDALVDLVPARTILDGELCTAGDLVYWLFDVLEVGGEDLRALGYVDRYERLKELAPVGEQDIVRLTPTAWTSRQKRRLHEQLLGSAAEGIVFKRGDAPYAPGRPASKGPHLKYKYIKSADVFITANAGNAYQMAVFEGNAVREVGRVFAGTTNESRKQLDEALGEGLQPVVEVRYLYATDANVLYQPVFAQFRDDKEPGDCTLDQLQRTNRQAVGQT